MHHGTAHTLYRVMKETKALFSSSGVHVMRNYWFFFPLQQVPFTTSLRRPCLLYRCHFPIISIYFIVCVLPSVAMFTLYWIVKRSVAESVLDRASVHTRNAAFEAFSGPEQCCFSPLLKVECSVLDRFLNLQGGSKFLTHTLSNRIGQ